MLDLKLIRSQSETIAENCKNRNLDLDIPELLRLDEEVRGMNTQLDTIRQQRNEISKTMKQPLSPEKRQPLIESSKKVVTFQLIPAVLRTLMLSPSPK